MRAIADQALGELANIHARLGHIADLQKLVAENKGRDVRGPGKPLFLAAEEGLALNVVIPPGEGYRCGPLALAQIYESTHPGLPPPRKPLGHPPPGAMKFFLTAEIEQKKSDAKWMTKATELIRLKVKDKNERAARNRLRNGSVLAANDGNGHS